MLSSALDGGATSRLWLLPRGLSFPVIPFSCRFKCKQHKRLVVTAWGGRDQESRPRVTAASATGPCSPNALAVGSYWALRLGRVAVVCCPHACCHLGRLAASAHHIGPCRRCGGVQAWVCLRAWGSSVCGADPTVLLVLLGHITSHSGLHFQALAHGRFPENTRLAPAVHK